MLRFWSLIRSVLIHTCISLVINSFRLATYALWHCRVGSGIKTVSLVFRLVVPAIMCPSTSLNRGPTKRASDYVPSYAYALFAIVVVLGMAAFFTAVIIFAGYPAVKSMLFFICDYVNSLF